MTTGWRRRDGEALARAVLRIVDDGFAVAIEQALEVAHRDGDHVRDPGLGGKADESVGFLDLGMLGAQSDDCAVDRGAKGVEDCELWGLGNVFERRTCY